MINFKYFKVESLAFTVFFLCHFFIALGPMFTNIFVILVFTLSLSCYLKNRYKFLFLNYEVFLIFLIYLLITNLVIYNLHGIIRLFIYQFFCFSLFKYIKPKIIFSEKYTKIYLSFFSF